MNKVVSFRIVSWTEVSPLFIKIALSFFLTALAGFIAIHLANSFYAVAPFHYDSAGYLLAASNTYDFFKANGLIAALSQTISSKDSLDITLRLLFAPHFLNTLYGHMAVLLPFMGLFIFLMIHYVYLRTHSWLLSFAAISFLFCFPMIYSPYLGISDYWKDTIAIWILGSAIISWFLSNEFIKSGWSFLCGLLLGLLVMQRSCLVVYAIPMFLPFFLRGGYQRIKNDGFKNGAKKIIVFMFPAILLAICVAILQWKLLYEYYTVIAYGIYSHFEMAKIINEYVYSLSYQFYAFFIGFPLLLLANIYLICCCCFSINWKQQGKDIFTAVWMVLAFIFVIIASVGLYQGFGMVFSILLLILLATFIPQFFSSTNQLHKFALMLIIFSVSASVLQFKLSSERKQTIEQGNAVWRVTYNKLIDIIVAQPKPRYVSILFDEIIGGPFSTQAKFNNGLVTNSPDGIMPVGFMSVHDSYYRYRSNSKYLSVQEYVNNNIKDIERHEGTLAITYCNSKQAFKSPVFLEEGSGKRVAASVAEVQAKYLLNNPNWRKINKLNSPYGELCVYRYSKGV